VETFWSGLSQPVKTILERVDINRKGLKLEKEKMLEIPYFKGIITKEIIDEIKLYEKTEENEGYFRTQEIGDVLLIEFLKSPN
jgi:hypothetical protein